MLLFFYRFVDKPKKGIAFLQDKGILGNKPEDIAKLFYTDERFDKVMNDLI